MSDNFIPMVSTTPPPLDGNFDDDYDDFHHYGSENKKWDYSDDDFDNFSDTLHIPQGEKSPQKSALSESYNSCKSNAENFPDQIEKQHEYLPDNKSTFHTNLNGDDTSQCDSGKNNNKVPDFPNSPFVEGTSNENVSVSSPIFGSSTSKDQHCTGNENGAYPTSFPSVGSHTSDNIDDKDSSSFGRFHDSHVDLPSKPELKERLKTKISLFDKSNFEEVRLSPDNRSPLSDSLELSTTQSFENQNTETDLETTQKGVVFPDKIDDDFGNFDSFQSMEETQNDVFKNKRRDSSEGVHPKIEFSTDTQFTTHNFENQNTETVLVTTQKGVVFPDKIDDDFGNFDSFQSTEETQNDVFKNKRRDSIEGVHPGIELSTDTQFTQKNALDEIKSTNTVTEDDGFAAFDETHFSSFPSTEVNFSDSTFGTTSSFDKSKTYYDANQPSKGDGDDFGDFGSAQFFPQPQLPTQSNFLPANDISKIPQWFHLPDNSKLSDDTVHHIHDHTERNLLKLFNKCEGHVAPGAITKKTASKPTDIWELLEDVDNAVALKFKWNGSASHQRLLNALGINTQNVLFSGGNAPYYVPTYASGLGLLQPNTDQSSPILPSISTPSPTADIPMQPVADTTIWGSKRNREKIDPELLELAMTVTPDSASVKKPDPLTKILASLKVSSSRKNSEEDESLSEEAGQAMRKLPDLSYMRSRVLMFPLSQSAAN